jgi:hypothetical protein
MVSFNASRSVPAELNSTPISPLSRGLPIRGRAPKSPGRSSQPWRPSPTCSGRSEQCLGACAPECWPISGWPPPSWAWSSFGAGGIRGPASKLGSLRPGKLRHLDRHHDLSHCPGKLKLSNAVRHGNPAEISVSVTSAPAEVPGLDCVTVEVANDGREIDKTAGFGFGLTGMQDRVQALGGRLVLTRKPGLGFSVTATVPFPAPSNRLRASSFGGGA